MTHKYDVSVEKYKEKCFFSEDAHQVKWIPGENKPGAESSPTLHLFARQARCFGAHVCR